MEANPPVTTPRGNRKNPRTCWIPAVLWHHRAHRGTSTIGPGTGSPPASPHPAPAGHLRAWGLQRAPGPQCHHQAEHIVTVPASRAVSAHGHRQQRAGMGPESSPRSRWASSRPCPHMGHSSCGSAPAAAGDCSLQPIPHRKARKLLSASRFPPAVPQDAMQSSLMHLDSFMGMRKCFQVSHKVPLRSQSHSIFSALTNNAFPSHPGAPEPRGAGGGTLGTHLPGSVGSWAAPRLGSWRGQTLALPS